MTVKHAETVRYEKSAKVSINSSNRQRMRVTDAGEYYFSSVSDTTARMLQKTSKRINNRRLSDCNNVVNAENRA